MSSWPQPVKIYSYGPVFRYERPQSGRYRQFNQFNFDIFGDENYPTDVEIIQIAYNFLRDIGLKNIIIEINSLGSKKCRTKYNKDLKKYLKKESLCSDCTNRLDKNPLRFLDCKEESCQRIKVGAPKIIDYLEEDTKKEFMSVLETLDFIGIPYSLNHSLVRGLDYYTKTVFEISLKNKDGESLSLGGGGRYDNMIKLFGGGQVPACGFGIGIERVASEMKNKKEIADKKNIFYLAQLGSSAKNNCFQILEEARKANLNNIYSSLQKDSLKAQLNQANKLGVCYVLILGQKEFLEKKIIIRDMKTGEQETIKQDNLIKTLKKLTKTGK
jgi:histidyl-tRNA synthetase